MPSHPPVPKPKEEEQRLRELERYGLIGQGSDEHFNRLVELTSSIFDAPMAGISLVGADRQWCLASRGLASGSTPRQLSICSHIIEAEDLLVVPDTLADEQFRHHPLVVSEPGIRFYAGAPLMTPDRHCLGALCVLDHKPHQFDERQRRQLRLLAEQVMRELELRRLHQHCPVTGMPHRRTFLKIAEREFRRSREDGHALSLLCFDIDNFRQINIRWGHHRGDEVLFDLCQLARGFLREEDFSGRLGDGEFALLFVGLDHQQALAIAEGLREAVTHMGGVHIHSDYKLHISGGLTSIAPEDRTFSDMLHRADQAMELAKISGRNQISVLLISPDQVGGR